MNTIEITKALRGVSAQSIGVYAADRIPKILSLPAAIVANIDTSDKRGSHWIALYIDKNAFGSYFDSYGLPPISTHHLDRIKRNCKRYQYNKKKLQSLDSRVCGEYCIMFLYHMCSGINLRGFSRIFSRDTRRNDKLAAEFYRVIVKQLKNKKKLNRIHSFPREKSTGGGLCNQSCTSRI